MVADAVGRLMELWGFRGVMGRIWAMLYLSEEPLPASELCGRLGISTGAASMALNELERWGVVQRRKMTGNRKSFFEAEIDVWKMVSRVFRERELVQLGEALQAFERAAELFRHEARMGDRSARLAGERTEKLTELTRVGQTLLRALVDRGQLDVRPLLAWTRWARARSPWRSA
ncbi:Transcriptional regulatory protein [Vulgatibacter incomptus]|uniref:HTH-type transcriptional regulator n=1 Tax=Vulgatibacter incomptus TaxID=1391653 RepID=A0A0K1P8J8_9BACT|nr:Transcriptional regulatory protein [Vulgatibacter incomptus]